MVQKYPYVEKRPRGKKMTAATRARARQPFPNVSYIPPEHWQEITLRDLLSDTSRWPDDGPQLSFLDNLTPNRSAIRFHVFVAGDISLIKQPCVSVIGTRKVSLEGAARARRVAKELVRHGVVVISGLAEGVDTEAMTAAIANGGHTIGVIGTPLDKTYPAKNAELQEEVYRDHLLISQFAHGTTTYKSNFPQRNRLMAFLSDASVIIEASDTSGTLHQAAECQRLGRWLFISKSIAEDPTLEWPRSFLGQPKTAVLEKVEDILGAIEREHAD